MEQSYYAEYASIQDTHWWYLARAGILQAVLGQYLEPSRDRCLLDLGCGPGGLRPRLSRFGRLVSTDFNFEALEFCQAQHLDYLVAADGGHLPFASGTFEAACALDVIEHLADDTRITRELFRVLKPQGLAIITVPAYQWLWGRQDIVSHHHRRYHRRQLCDCLSAAGFTVLRASYFNTLLFPPVALVRVAFRCLGLNRGKTSADVGSDLTLSRPGLLNSLLYRVFSTERFLLRHANLPFGVSLLCVVRKDNR